jgi:hypothetical protein
MPAQSQSRNRQEIERAAARLRRELGQAPTLFAYPFGEYSAAVRALVAGTGFAGAFAQHSGAIGPTSDRYALPRFALNEAYGTPERFAMVVETLPLPALDIAPADPVLPPDRNPPAYGFTVPPVVGDLERLNCYAGGTAEARVQRLDRRVEVRFASPMPPGRTRVNCTLPGPRGRDGQIRWRWHGHQFVVPEPQ